MGACGSARSAKRVDKGNGRRRWRGRSFSKRHRRCRIRSDSREIQDHVLTGHASFRSWCAACVRGRGRAERDIVVMATKKMRTVPKFQYYHGINFFCRKRPKQRCRHRAARRQSRPGDARRSDQINFRPLDSSKKEWISRDAKML